MIMSAQKKFMKIRSSRIFKQLDNSISQSKYLTHLNEIKKIAQPVNGYVYDKTCVPHDHLDCIQCHGLYNVSHPNQKNLDEDMQKLSGWDIHTHIEKTEEKNMELKGSKTEQNLMAAFAGESQARNKYTYYAQKAREEGMDQIANIFEETARNEQEHAKLWYKALHNNQINDTMVNLEDAAAGENYEWTDMYKGFAETACAH